MKAKPNRIYTNKDGCEIEEEWIEKISRLAEDSGG